MKGKREDLGEPSEDYAVWPWMKEVWDKLDRCILECHEVRWVHKASGSTWVSISQQKEASVLQEWAALDLFAVLCHFRKQPAEARPLCKHSSEFQHIASVPHQIIWVMHMVTSEPCFFFTFWWYWSLNSGLHICKAGALLFEARLQPFGSSYFWNRVLLSHKPGPQSTYFMLLAVAEMTGTHHHTQFRAMLLTKTRQERESEYISAWSQL
jgi:hypothetical protein